MLRPSPFSLDVVAEGSKTFYRGEHRYVSMPPNSKYKIILRNDSDTFCDVDLFIDDVSVGTWRVDAKSATSIERPANSPHKFVLVSETGAIARMTGAVPGDFFNGLVRALFKPALLRSKHMYSAVALRPERPTMARAAPTLLGATPSMAAPSMEARASAEYSAGLTVLGEESYQTFDRAPALRDIDIDWDDVREITIRLVVKDQPEYMSLTSLERYPPRLVTSNGYPSVGYPGNGNGYSSVGYPRATD